MPFVSIDVLAGRPPELLERLIARVSETVAETLDTPVDRVRVVIHEIPPHLWGIGGVPASQVPGRVPASIPRPGATPAATKPAAVAAAPRPPGSADTADASPEVPR